MTELENRIIEISNKYNLSHRGSCLTAVGIIDEIYQTKKPDEKFILSCGHAGLALYCILEKYEGKDAEQLYLKHGTHPNFAPEDGIYCSTGSLGHGASISLGMAIADKTKNVYCLISDGEAHEGIINEVANTINKYNIKNLKIYMNYNGYSAYDAIPKWFIWQLKSIMPEMVIKETNVSDYGYSGLEAHYVTK